MSSGIGANEGWQSTPATDGDQDGCRDNDEDEDDDNDGIVDTYDLCPESYGWVSTPSADYDYDGCHDANEDDDDEDDGVHNVSPLGPKRVVLQPVQRLGQRRLFRFGRGRQR